MTREELFTTLRQRLREIGEEQGLLDTPVTIGCVSLTAEQAIGVTEKKDYPILVGKEVMLQADFDGGIGQSFTSCPSSYSGTLAEVLALDVVHNEYDRSIFIAVLNAVMRRLGRCDRSIHCRNEGPEECAEKMAQQLRQRFPPTTRIAQIGFQPAMLSRLSQIYTMRCLDLNPDNVGKVKYGVEILDGVADYAATIAWADVVLCTGSTLCNGTIVNFMDLEKPVLFYGTTSAGAAPLLGLERLCHAN